MHEESAFIDLYRTWWGVVCDAAAETEAPVLADPAPLPDHGLLQADRGKLAADLIGRLPRRCQEVCALVFLTGMGHGEVAERLGITEKAVEKQVARGRRILRKVVGSQEWPRVSTFGDGGGEGLFASIG